MKTNNQMINCADTETTRFIENTAKVLVAAYQLSKLDCWVWELGDGDEATLHEVLEKWMRTLVKYVTEDQLDAAFLMVHSEFEKHYYSRNLEGDLHG